MTEPVWVEEREVLVLHDRLLAIHRGVPGDQDYGLLKSALARPQQHLAYADESDIIDLTKSTLRPSCEIARSWMATRGPASLPEFSF